MATPQHPLSEYNRKRDFSKTAEPRGKGGSKASQGKLFLIQKHDATRLHYDFRLEWKGVLKSWAVTRGPSLNPADKRLAVRTEDHPMAYGDFEGTIPKKQYGGGTVMLWDSGWWEPVEDPDIGLKQGKLKFLLHGARLTGGWTLVRMKPRAGEKRENWLLIKEHDDIADEDGEAILSQNTTSVKTGRTMEEIAGGKGEPKARVWESAKSAAANVKAGAVAPLQTGRRNSPKPAGKLPDFQKPQLATLVLQAPEGEDWLNEVKFDGYRLMIAVGGGDVRCYTRTGLDWTEKFPDIASAFSTLRCKSALIDGEAVAASSRGSKFSALQHVLKNGGRTAFYAFDLLALDGKDIARKPLVERKDMLKGLLDTLTPGGTVKYSEHVRGNGEKVFTSMCKAGQEGIIAKRADAPYRHSRSSDWRKVKCTRRQEFVIGGYSPSDKRGRAFASLLVGTFSGRRFVYQGRVGTGFGEETMDELAEAFARRKRKTAPFDAVPADIARKAVWLEPDLVAEVDFAEFTDDGHIRHGAFQGLRSDKKARDVRLDVRLESEKPVMDEQTEKQPKTRRPAPKAETKSKSKAATSKPASAKSRRTATEDEVLGIRITHPERVVFSGQDITKIDLARYYAVVADKLLKQAAGHPVSLLRCPQGKDGQCFYQKHASEGFPGEIGQVPITESSGDTENYMVIRDAKGLVAAVQMGTMEFHIWGSSAEKLEKPDRLVFDLDPDPSVGFAEVKKAAVHMRDTLETVGLKSLAMVTGGKGVHVIVPLTPRTGWEDAKAFAKGLALKFADADPARYIATMSKARRKGRIFIDWLRNERGATAVAPYSMRARTGGPAATPVSWEELEKLDAANGFSMADVIERLENGIDPWQAAGKWKQSLTARMVDAVSD